MTLYHIGESDFFFVNSSSEFKECLLPMINKSLAINLREVPDQKWTTALFEDFHAYKGGMHINCILCRPTFCFLMRNMGQGYYSQQKLKLKLKPLKVLILFSLTRHTKKTKTEKN